MTGMDFLARLEANSATTGYESLGYMGNPFPARGQVWPEVYAPRTELTEVFDSLEAFLLRGASGRVWAIGGESGTGKTNVLQHIDWSLSQAQERGSLRAIHRYFASQQVTPAALADQVAQAIGADRLSRLANDGYALPTSTQTTDFGRAFDAVRCGAVPVDEWTRIMIRWLGGGQTFASERRALNIETTGRLPPPIAFVYLRHLLDAFESASIGGKLVLLLDEFEDIEALRPGVRSDYLMTLKGLVNAFNLKNVMLIVAGQESAFTKFGLQLPSLATRWSLVRLRPVKSSDEAVALVQFYKQRAHVAFAESKHKKPQDIGDLEPGRSVVEAEFGRAVSKKGIVSVTQREVLASLHEWFESRVQGK